MQRKIGPAWTGRGRPAAGYVTKRLAEDWLRSVLEQARRGTLAGQVKTGAMFADAAAEWLRYIEHDRARKPSTVAGYRAIVRSQLLLWSIGAWPLCTSTDSLEDDVHTAPLVLASARVLANGGPPPASKFCIDGAEEQPVPRKSEWLLAGWKRA